MLGKIDWVIDTLYLASAVNIGIDSNLYVSVFNNYLRTNQNVSGLLKLNESGSVMNKIRFDSQEFYDSNPIIGNDGTIYISANYEDRFYAFNQNGTVKWIMEDISIHQTGINIDKDGTIYAIGVSESNNINLFAISKNGGLLWQLREDFGGYSLYSMSFSPDSKSLYITAPYTDGAFLYAVDIENHSIKWEFGNGVTKGSSAPIVDVYGNIYFIAKQQDNYKGIVYSLNDSGKIRWSYELENEPAAYNPMCLDKLGNLYLGYEKLISLDHKGNKRWEYGLNKNVASPISVDSQGKIYFVIGNYTNTEIISLNSEGEFLWSISEPNLSKYSTNFSLSIGYNNKLYVPTFESFKLVSIK
jgi:hypothetical protein